MRASTSETAATLGSTSVDSIFSERMTFIGFFPCFACDASADVPRTTKVTSDISAADFDRIAANMRQCSIFRGSRLGRRRGRRSPAALESGAEALVRGSERRFADQARYADAVEQFLLGADLAKPFVVGGRQRLAGDQAGAGVGNAQFGGAVDFIISRRMSGHAGHRHRRQVYAVCARQTAMPLLDRVVAVLQGERILLA